MKVQDSAVHADYIVDENGRYIFTREFHLRRGFCCGLKCKHCPYDGQRLSRRVVNREKVSY